MVDAPGVVIPRALDPVVQDEMQRLDKVASDWVRPLRKLDGYVTGEQPLTFLSDAMRREFGEDLTQLVLNFPGVVVDAYNDRLDVEGFRFPGESSGDADLWAAWQANRMDLQSSMAMEEALGLSRAAVIVGENPGGSSGAPVISVESALDVAWIRDPATGDAVLGQKRWCEADRSEWRTLYEPGRRLLMTLDRGGWRVVKETAYSLGRLPLVPLVNRPRIRARDGRPEFEAIIPVADAANKIATDMMTSAEYHAMPRRWAFGLKKSDFQNADGSQKSSWSFIKGRLWANESKDVKVGQFPESDLANFHNTIKLLARLVGQLAGLPIDYLSFDSVNPPSADALRSAESRLVKRVERRQVAFGDSWEEVMRLVLLTMGRSLPPEAMRLETVWRDPATPTIGQKYDAIVKAVTTRGADGRPLVPTEQGRIDLGYTPAQREDMSKMERDAVAVDPFIAAANDLAGRSDVSSNGGG